MHCEWTDEQRGIRQAAAEFAERELWPGFAERDEAARFDRTLWQKLADFGLFAMTASEEVGGRGRPLEELVLTLEGLGQSLESVVHRPGQAIEFPDRTPFEAGRVLR